MTDQLLMAAQRRPRPSATARRTGASTTFCWSATSGDSSLLVVARTYTYIYMACFVNRLAHCINHPAAHLWVPQRISFSPR